MFHPSERHRVIAGLEIGKDDGVIDGERARRGGVDGDGVAVQLDRIAGGHVGNFDAGRQRRRGRRLRVSACAQHDGQHSD